MRIKEGYLLDEIGGRKFAIALDQEGDKFVGMIQLNETGAFLWEMLSEERSEQELARALVKRFGAEESQAREDVQKFTVLLRKQKVLED